MSEAQLLEEQRRCWQRGERVLVETLLEKHLVAHVPEELLLDLIYNEFLLREGIGEALAVEEYYRRFPSLAGQLRLQFQADQALRSHLPERNSSGPERGLLSDLLSSRPTVTQTTTPTMPELPTIPGYELLGVLGRGGMGVVYQARHLRLNRVVALKMVLSGAHVPPHDLQRFISEAETLAALQHPNVVQIFDSGQHQGLPYFALEFVPGGSLADLIREQTLPPRQAAELVQKIALGVHAVHQKGIVHRDLKPANVLLAAGGSAREAAKPRAAWIPKVTDFGLAKRIEDSSGVTRTGDVLGTPSYMAPEQAEGQAKLLGPATDVYALGGILYECLTGRPPFRSASPWDTLAQVLNEEPVSVRRLQPSCPRDLETICHRCLQKDARRRYHSALALADDLERFQAGEPIAARPVGALERLAKWTWRRPVVAALIGLVALTLVAGTGVSSFFAYQESVSAAVANKAKTDFEGKAEDEKRARLEAEEKERQRKVQLERARANLLTAQLARVDALYLHEPARALELLHDVSACPLDLRDPGWRFYERACSHRPYATLTGHLGQNVGFTFSGQHLLCMNSSGGEVTSVAFSPDGKLLATGSEDKTVKLWDPATGQPRTTLKGHTDKVSAVVFSSDGKLLATSSDDRTAKLWDVVTGQHRTLNGHTGRVTSVASSPDARALATGSDDRTVKLWDVATGEQRTLKGHSGGVTSVAFNPNGKLLATGSGDKTARLWDVATGQPRATLEGYNFGVRSVAFSPDGKLLATASFNAVKLWDVTTAQPHATFTLLGDVQAVAFSPDGRLLAAANKDQTVKVWDVTTRQQQASLQGVAVTFSPDGKFLATASGETAKLWDVASAPGHATLGGHSSFVLSVAFSPDGKLLATASDDKTVRLWDATTCRPRGALEGHAGGVTSVAFSLDGKLLATGSTDQTVKLWDVTTGQPRTSLEGRQELVRSVAFSPDGNVLATGSDDMTVQLWDVSTGEPRLTFKGHTGKVMSVGFSPDGKTLVTGSADATVKLWDVVTGQVRATLEGHGRTGESGVIASVVFSPDGKTLASGSYDKTVKLWDVSTGQERASLTGHTGFVSAVAFSADGKTLVSGSFDKTVKLWDVATKQQRATFDTGHSGVVSSLAFRPDGHVLATGSFDGTVKLWDVAPGPHYAVLQGHTAVVISAAFSADGKLLATGSADQTVQLWDVATVEPRTSFKGHTGGVSSVAFSPDGRLVASGSYDSTARLWDVEMGQSLATLTGYKGQVLSVTFSPDSKVLATGSTDKIVKLWDTTTGQEQATLTGHPEMVVSVVFSPDGQLLACGCGDVLNRGKPSEVWLWDTATRQQRARLQGHAEAVVALAFNQEGTRLVTRDKVDRVLVWDPRTGQRLDEEPPRQMLSGPVSPNGRLRADLGGNTVPLIDLTWTSMLPPRIPPGRPDPDWHRDQARQAEGDKQWLATAFHLEQALSVEPTEGDLRQRLTQALNRAVSEQPDLSTIRRRLALAQFASHQTPSFLQTCRQMQEQFRVPGPVFQVGFAFQGTPIDPLAALVAKALLRHPALPSGANLHDRLLTIRTSVLRPNSLSDPEAWLSSLPDQEKLLRGAVLCRAGKHADAVQELKSSPEPLAGLFRALAEHGRGDLAAARLALQEALKHAPPEHIDPIEQTPTPWLQRVEFEVLRREAEALIK